jgi:hypothetical protein
MRISESDTEHEVVGPTTIFAHLGCYSIWQQESDALARTPREPGKKTAPLHIDREDRDGVNPHTTEYSLSFGSSKDRVGTVLIAKRKGLDALRAFLENLDIAGSDIESACSALIAQPHHKIPDVRLRLAMQRSLRDSSSTS